MASPDGGDRLNIALQSLTVTYQGTSTKLIAESPDFFPVSCTLDSGTPTQNLPDSLFLQMLEILKGDPETWAIDCGIANAPGGFTYGFDGVDIFVPFSELVLPPEGANDPCSLGVVPLGYFNGTEQDTTSVLGDTFMRSAYILFNYDAMTISLAQAVYGSSCQNCEVALN